MSERDVFKQALYEVLLDAGMNVHMFGAISSLFQPEIANFAQEQEDILRVLTVFAVCIYDAHPTFEQFVSFCYDAEVLGYSLKNLYEIFSSGTTSQDLDALIKKHMESWPPAGETVESELHVKRLEP